MARGAGQDLVDRLAFANRIVITGAGSSYYIAQVAASAMRAICHLPAVAAPLSEVLLRPDEVFAEEDHANQPVIVVSRSGTTTEALDVIRATRADGHHALAVTCRPASGMAALAKSVLAVPEADESAIVMTRSFVALVTLLMRLGARLGDPSFGRDLIACRPSGVRRSRSSKPPSGWPPRIPRASSCWAAGQPTAWPTRRS